VLQVVESRDASIVDVQRAGLSQLWHLTGTGRVEEWEEEGRRRSRKNLVLLLLLGGRGC
jgi:hypothetical protein